MNDVPLDPPTRPSLLLRVALLPVAATLNFAINLFGMVVTSGQGPDRRPLPPVLRVYWVSSLPAFTWVVLSIPVQMATRRLVRKRLAVAVLAHVVVAAGFLVSNSVLLVALRLALGVANPRLQYSGEVARHATATLPQNLLIYAALVAGRWRGTTGGCRSVGSAPRHTSRRS
jgi:hypothetical protein